MFVHPHLDYADTIFDKPGNVDFESKLERVLYNRMFLSCHVRVSEWIHTL